MGLTALCNVSEVKERPTYSRADRVKQWGRATKAQDDGFKGIQLPGARTLSSRQWRIKQDSVLEFKSSLRATGRLSRVYIHIYGLGLNLSLKGEMSQRG